MEDRARAEHRATVGPSHQAVPTGTGGSTSVGTTSGGCSCTVGGHAERSTFQMVALAGHLRARVSSPATSTPPYSSALVATTCCRAQHRAVGFCPGCGGRRMNADALTLVENLLSPSGVVPNRARPRSKIEYPEIYSSATCAYLQPRPAPRELPMKIHLPAIYTTSLAILAAGLAGCSSTAQTAHPGSGGKSGTGGLLASGGVNGEGGTSGVGGTSSSASGSGGATTIPSTGGNSDGPVGAGGTSGSGTGGGSGGTSGGRGGAVLTGGANATGGGTNLGGSTGGTATGSGGATIGGARAAQPPRKVEARAQAAPLPEGPPERAAPPEHLDPRRWSLVLACQARPRALSIP